MKFIVELTPNPEENALVAEFLTTHWVSEKIVTRGKITDASRISRIVGFDENGSLIGLATFSICDEDKSCELLSINAEVKRKGIGTRMLQSLEKVAKEQGVKRIWLITTNDNFEAAAFYIMNGYRLVNVHKNALDLSRQLKPQIPTIGKYGIPMQDEWEFEKVI